MSVMQDSLNENFGLELFKLIAQAVEHGVPVEAICAALAEFDEKEVRALRMGATLVDHEAELDRAVRDKRNAALRDKCDDPKARVNSLKKAIENLKAGDLEKVLDFDEAAPLDVAPPGWPQPKSSNHG